MLCCRISACDAHDASFSSHFNLQQLADESQMRIELQMALDSKDSDIEQLRNLLQTLSVQSMDSASVSSGPEFDADDAYTGKSQFWMGLFTHITFLMKWLRKVVNVADRVPARCAFKISECDFIQFISLKTCFHQ